MLNLIRIRLSENSCDDVMEMAWSSMWNVTDETPENCRKFLDSGGMNAFLDCCKVSFFSTVLSFWQVFVWTHEMSSMCEGFRWERRTAPQHDGSVGQCSRSERASASVDEPNVHCPLRRAFGITKWWNWGTCIVWTDSQNCLYLNVFTKKMCRSATTQQESWPI